MERRMKPLIIVLLSLLLCLGAATGSRVTPAESTPPAQAQTQTDSKAVVLYAENGLWGAKTAGGRVLIEPAWYYLRKMSSSVLIARKSGGANDRYGLLSTDGDLRAPLIYTSFHQLTDDIWAAELTETGSSREQYHLYREDGTRWQDAVWDTCTCADGLLTLTSGQNSFSYAVTEDGWQRQAWHSEHSVGIHTLRMEWDEAQLSLLPEDEILLELGDAAAAYLTYLFLTGEAPDASLLTAEDTASLRVGYRYRNCTLATANVSRLRILQTDGYPSYSIQLSVTYRRDRTDDEAVISDTAMLLTVTRNAAGEYTYSGFTDIQAQAAPSSILN